jgi:hypothetical protein
MALLAGTMLNMVSAIPARVSRQLPLDPFAPIDPQNWVCIQVIVSSQSTPSLTSRAR